MKTSELRPSDIPELAALHAKMGSLYGLPNFNSPLMAVREVCRDNDGKLIGAVAGKVFLESFLFLEPELSVQQRFYAIRHMSRVAIAKAKSLGLEETSAWIPPQVEPQFTQALICLGWISSPWHSWSKIL